MRHKQLSERAHFVKTNRGELIKMGNYSDELEERARLKGEKNNLLENIRSLMETMKLTAQQAMDALKVPADKQEEIRNLI